jgi:hypothetical protein
MVEREAWEEVALVEEMDGGPGELGWRVREWVCWKCGFDELVVVGWSWVNGAVRRDVASASSSSRSSASSSSSSVGSEGTESSLTRRGGGWS